MGRVRNTLLRVVGILRKKENCGCHIPLNNARHRYDLFNQAFQYLILNFKLWHQSEIKPRVENQLADVVADWCLDQPQYMYRLVNVRFLLDEIRRHFAYDKHKHLPSYPPIFVFFLLLFLLSNAC